jgi:hypothetical protein
MVVDQVNIADSVRRFAGAANQPPVSGDRQAPKPFQAAFQRKRLPARKPSELLNRLGSFEGEQKLAQLVGLRERVLLAGLSKQRL